MSKFETQVEDVWSEKLSLCGCREVSFLCSESLCHCRGLEWVRYELPLNTAVLGLREMLRKRGALAGVDGEQGQAFEETHLVTLNLSKYLLAKHVWARLVLEKTSECCWRGGSVSQFCVEGIWTFLLIQLSQLLQMPSGFVTLRPRQGDVIFLFNWAVACMPERFL